MTRSPEWQAAEPTERGTKRDGRGGRSGSRPRWSLAFVSIVATGIALFLWAFVLEPRALTVQEEDLALPAFRGAQLRVAVLTDLHVGSPFHSLGKLREIVERANALNPDVTVVLGDLVIHGVIGGRFVPPEPIAEVLSGLAAPGGVFAVLGNHDHWLDAERVQASLESAGLKVLFDSAAPVGGLATPDGSPLWIAGLSDFWEGPHDVAKTLASIPGGDPVIMITHNPDVFPTVPDRVSLTIAGHTHGGQVRFPFVGAPIVPSAFDQRFVEGHVVEEGRHLFVGAGTGTSMLPVRFRVPPRITVLNLSSAGPVPVR